MKDEVGGWTSFQTEPEQTILLKADKANKLLHIARSDHEVSTISLNYFVELTDNIGRECVMCLDGNLEQVSFESVAEPTLVCDSCEAEYGISEHQLVLLE
jgi:hypothetical protein